MFPATLINSERVFYLKGYLYAHSVFDVNIPLNLQTKTEFSDTCSFFSHAYLTLSWDHLKCDSLFKTEFCFLFLYKSKHSQHELCCQNLTLTTVVDVFDLQLRIFLALNDLLSLVFSILNWLAFLPIQWIPLHDIIHSFGIPARKLTICWMTDILEVLGGGF